MLLQLDRLIIPYVLTVQDLALLWCACGVAGSLFRVLSMGVGYTLVPRLRAAEGMLQRRLLIAHEAKLVGAIVVGGALVIWFATPLVERWFLAVVSGWCPCHRRSGEWDREGLGIHQGDRYALATPDELSRVNLYGWGSVVLAVLAAMVGARWGWRV